jgi:hypothetical protein
MRQQFGAFACALMVLVMGCARDPLSWQRYTENDFPARVRSVITSVGSVLDAERGLNYRQWTVSFGKGIPYAFYNCPKNKGCEIIIRNLKCDHSSSERVSCELKLYNDDNATCDLVIPERETLHIPCPLDVSLEPELLPRRRDR